MKFEWNVSKDFDNQRKHNLSFSEAVESFSDKNGFVLEDLKHSQEEDRFYWIGLDKLGRVLTVRFVRRGNLIRIFGCAEWREFKKLYYEKTKNS